MHWGIITNDYKTPKIIKKMIKKYSIIFFSLLLICMLQAENFSFLHIPIQEEGRIKPLDTFARNQLLKLYGKKELTTSWD